MPARHKEGGVSGSKGRPDGHIRHQPIADAGVVGRKLKQAHACRWRETQHTCMPLRLLFKTCPCVALQLPASSSALLAGSRWPPPGYFLLALSYWLVLVAYQRARYVEPCTAHAI